MAQDLVGVTINNRYKILNELGRGGLAVVYRAEDLMLKRSVALKMILPEEQQSSHFLRRFQREARVLARLAHPSIVKILDFGEYQQTPYLVMEYIPGGTLNKFMGKPIPYREAARLLLPVAHALQHAHLHKVIHRDIKPANILLDESGQPMLSDFGIAKLTDAEEGQSLTGTGVIIGTPSYMAPEQIQGGAIDGRTDVYALGVLLYEMVTGRRPFVANTPIEITYKHISEPIPRARNVVRDLPLEVEHVIQRAMAKRPENRFQDMASMCTALERLAQGQKTIPREGFRLEPQAEEERPPTTEKVAGHPLRKRRLAWAGIAGGAALSAAAGLAIWFALGPGWLGPGGLPATPSAALVSEATAAPTVVATTLVPTEIPPTPEPSQTAAPTLEPSPAPTIPTTPTPDVLVIGPENIGNLTRVDRLSLSVKDVDWTPDGRWILAAGTGVIQVVDAGSMAVTNTINLANPKEVPRAICSSPDSRLAYVLVQNQVRVINLENRATEVIALKARADSLAVSPDGKMLVLGIVNNYIQVIDAESGQELQNKPSNSGGWDVAFSPPGGLVAAGTNQGVLMWKTSGNWASVSLPSGQENQVKSLAFSMDGKRLAAGTDGALWVWDVESAQRSEVWLRKNSFADVNDLSFSPDGRILVFGTQEGKLWFYDALEGALIANKIESHSGGVTNVIFSPDGRYLVTTAEGLLYKWGLP